MSAPREPIPASVTEGPWLGGRLVLRQPARGRGHRAGSDAALLAATADPRSGETVVDLGAGTGAVGLALAARVPDLAVVLVEREPELVALAAWNAAANGFSARARVVEADILAPARARRAAGLLPGCADLVATNPPYLDPARARSSPVAARAAAHTAGPGGLAAWVAAAAWLLKPGGRLALIHRADALADCLAAVAGAFGGVAVRPVHPRAEAPASRLLLTAARGSRAPGEILPALVLHGPDGAFLPLAADLHAGAALEGSGPPLP